MFRPFADALAATPLSVTLQNTAWVVPASQSLHIVAISIVFASAMLINLRLLGVGARGGVAWLADLLVPWIWRALACWRPGPVIGTGPNQPISAE
jgi:hypothetical protein